MKSFLKTTLKFLFVVVYIFAVGCASQRSVEDEEFSVSDSTSSDASLDDFESDSSSSKSSSNVNESSSSETSNQSNESKSSEKNEFSELENESSSSEQKQQQAQTEKQSSPDQAKHEDEAALEEELNKIGKEEQQQQQAQQSAQQEQQQPTQEDELTLDDPQNQQNQQQQALQEQQQQQQEQLPEQVIADQNQQQEPQQEAAVTPEPTVGPVPEEKPVEITGLKYKANDNGGTIVIEANGPIQYTSRKNEQLNQVIIEVNNVVLPTKFMRTLNTKDMVGSIGAIDAYQNKDSKIARFVVQMRGTGKELAIQQEGNALLIVGEGAVPPVVAESTSPGQEQVPAPEAAVVAEGANIPIPAPEIAAKTHEEGMSEVSNQEPLQAKSLEEFLTTHQNFTGKKISIEMQAPVIEVIKLIMDESGANIIIDDSVGAVGGDKITFKLREIPWDQALVTVLKMKGLAYSRVGNVLRITRQQDLEVEQKKLDDLRASRAYADFKVRMFPLSYAKLEDMQKSIADLLSKEDPITKERGKSILDPNTNSIIVTDSDSVLDKVAKVIKVLDVAPAQVSIETRIVEASEKFQRTLGVRWGFTGNPTEVSTNQQGSVVNLTPTFSSKPTFQSGIASLGFNVGTLDLFGSLDASLSLGEQEDIAKVVASPRVVTLNNQAATIGATSKVSYTNSSVTQGTGGATTSTQSSVTEVPLTLQVKPIVSNDGFIKMDVNFTKTTISALKGTSQPDTEERKISNQVIVKDGQTMVIGGVFNSTENISTDGVPGLKDVPLLGALFRSKSTVKSKNELLIFITPKILSKFNLKGTSEPYVN